MSKTDYENNLKIAISCSQLTLFLVNDILDLSQFEANKLMLMYEPM